MAAELQAGGAETQAAGTVEGVSAPLAPPIRVLVIEDDQEFLQIVSRLLTRAGCEVVSVADSVGGLAAAADPGLDVVVSDIEMPNLSGLDLLREIRVRHPGLEVVLMTGGATVDAAVEAMKMGAYDYLTKPFDHMDRLGLIVTKAAEKKRLADRGRALETMLDAKQSFEDLIGQGQKMAEVFRLIESVAPTSVTVLIQGESGTGKELVARAIHRRSPRKDRPFLALNCSALTETLLESELFGYVKGAFTGAVADRKGFFEAAAGGTVFLDEIGDVPPATQVRLLRVLQEGEIRRVGATAPTRVDVRVIAATNADLERARARGTLREDLFYRLNVIAIHLPALRERPEDVPPLVHHFLRKYAPRVGKQLTGVSAGAMRALTIHPWPGNVRELENAIERAAVLTRGPEVTAGDLPPGIGTGRRASEADPASLSHLPLSQAKKLAVGAFERQYLVNLLRRMEGSVSRAAAAAGVERSNFRKLLKAYGVGARKEAAGEAASGPGDEPGA
ncbi:MAG: sigma-54-dependent Fis family transcriptional regulator [Deltaproteobacteria bacterium]|nr:sigma-54-dependent Fis family transcriptional regulator [Deltaproteobacteria bacterium]